MNTPYVRTSGDWINPNMVKRLMPAILTEMITVIVTSKELPISLPLLAKDYLSGYIVVT